MTKTQLFSRISELRARTLSASDHCCEGASPDYCWLCHDHENVVPISADQATSLRAMIAHVAHMTGQNEFRIERDFANKFCVPNVKCLPFNDYDRALQYLTMKTPSQSGVA